MFDEKLYEETKKETFMEKVKRKAAEAWDTIGTTGYWVGVGVSLVGVIISESIGNKIVNKQITEAVNAAYELGKNDQCKYDNAVLDNAMDIAIRIHDGDK